MDKIGLVGHWHKLHGQIEGGPSFACRGLPLFEYQTMRYAPCLPQWFSLRDLDMEDAFSGTLLDRDFVGLLWGARLPARVTMLRLGNQLEVCKLGRGRWIAVNAKLTNDGPMPWSGAVVDATAGDICTYRNRAVKRCVEGNRAIEGKKWLRKMKSNFRMDANERLLNKVTRVGANLKDRTRACLLGCRKDSDVLVNAVCSGVSKPEEVQAIHVNWHVAMRPSKQRALDPAVPTWRVLEKWVLLKAKKHSKEDGATTSRDLGTNQACMS